MNPSSKTNDEELIFVPLGGVGEFGKNLALYGYAGQWIIVDCGMSFADETVPGVDLLVPDVSFIAEQKDRLLGLVLTHGH
ncbi:MAG: MBL fold metallo-hydrolase, partial [Alphaproteobacteria bacterium]|nr:MBL fold metallo-hydrolase [Alphaproteobacteria bacterium]